MKRHQSRVFNGNGRSLFWAYFRGPSRQMPNQKALVPLPDGYGLTAFIYVCAFERVERPGVFPRFGRLQIVTDHEDVRSNEEDVAAELIEPFPVRA